MKIRVVCATGTMLVDMTQEQFDSFMANPHRQLSTERDGRVVGAIFGAGIYAAQIESEVTSGIVIPSPGMIGVK